MSTAARGATPVATGKRDQRGTRRTKVFLLTEIADADGTAGSSRRAHVLDISPEGARIHARSATDAGGRVELVVDGEPQPASIMWVKHPTFGIRFASPLTSERLERIVAPD